MMSRAGARAATSRSCLARGRVPTVPSGGPGPDPRATPSYGAGHRPRALKQAQRQDLRPQLSEDMAEDSVTVSVDLEEGTVTDPIGL